MTCAMEHGRRCRRPSCAAAIKIRPCIFSVNTEPWRAFWAGLPAGLVTVLDVSATPPAGPFAELQAGFQASQAELLAYLQTPAGGGLSLAAAEQALVQGYHSNVAPFCAAAARAFFSQF